MKKTTYDQRTLAAAYMHLQKQTPLREIQRRLFIPVATASRWKNEGMPDYFQPTGTPEQEVEQPSGTDGTAIRTPEQATGTGAQEIAKNAVLAPENIVPSVPLAPEQAAKTPLVRGLDWLLIGVYFFTIGTGCIGIWNIFGVWAVLPIGCYIGISLHSITMAIDPSITKTAERARGTVVVLELVASVFDASLFNNLLWKNTKALPFEIKEKYFSDAGEWGLQNGWIPSLVAIFLSACMFAAAFYAVDTLLEITKERVKNKALNSPEGA